MSILIQPAISHLRESKLTFDDAELVLDFGTDPRLVPVPGALFISQVTVAAALRLGEILSLRVTGQSRPLFSRTVHRL